MQERATTPMPRTTSPDISIGQLLKDLSRDISNLMRQEMELARAEVSEKITQVSTGIATMIAGAVIIFAGLVIILEAAVVALAELLPSDLNWLSPLIVGIVVAIIGYAAVQKGKSSLQPHNLTLSRTSEELRRDKELVKEQVK